MKRSSMILANTPQQRRIIDELLTRASNNPRDARKRKPQTKLRNVGKVR